MIPPEREVTDVMEPADVCVVGGGMAGYCAALAAAREGARTVLIHDRPVFGGCGSTEMRVPFSGAGSHNPSSNETGIILELLNEERATSPHSPGYGMVNAGWDLILYDKARSEPSLTFLLNTSVRRVRMDGERIGSVFGYQAGSEKLWEVTSRLFIDATGDGAVGIAAGVPFRIGQESKAEYGESMAPDEPWDWTLGSSLIFRARDEGRPVAFSPPSWARLYEGEESLAHRPHRGFEGGYWWIEIGYPFQTIEDNEAIRDELLAHVYGVWDHIKNRCAWSSDAANWSLDWVGMLPAKRESRRFTGAHVLTQTEIAARTLFEDRVAYGGWIIDDHTRGGIARRDRKPSFDGTEETFFLVAPYSVPLRSMIAKDVPNLLFAGRDMSASRLAFNSLRVQRTLAVCGQAAGTAAAYCAARNQSPGQLGNTDVHTIQQSLLRQDCWIPRVRNEDPADLARTSTVEASSTRRLVVTPAPGPGMSLAGGAAQILPLSDAPQMLRIALHNSNEKPVELLGSLHRAEDIWDLPALEREPVCRFPVAVDALPRVPLVVVVPEFDFEPGLYWLHLSPCEGVSWRFQDGLPLPGLTAAYVENGRLAFAPGTFSNWQPLAADALPQSRCYGPENTINGVSRPEQWPNVWVSAGPAPQWLRLVLAAPHPLHTVQVAWGLNFHRSYFNMPAFHRAPECARDYRIEVVLQDGSRRLWAEVAGNYQRLAVHRAPKGLTVPVAEVLITVLATNGADRVEIDEVRLYREGNGG